ncbi:GNAT family N-acetyltransferase [Caballeronia sp. 15715]|jgi:[ribosomal protein S5]-alanine N-acetyltransferase|uniref:GNAT family N-acetyltransferase n=1 Tax=unclassified Caballeronia TaxID=2646786 RepID=UPI0039E29DA3
MKLIADRLYLRDIEPSDLDAVHDYASLLEVVLHQEWGPNTIEQTREFIEGCVLGSSLPDRRTVELAAVLNDGSLIGSYRATLSEDESEAEIGYSLHPRYWNQGFASEAAKRLVDYLVRERHVREIFATSRPENIASIHVLQKLGMRQVDLYRKNVLIRGEWRDTLVFSVKV